MYLKKLKFGYVFVLRIAYISRVGLQSQWKIISILKLSFQSNKIGAYHIRIGRIFFFPLTIFKDLSDALLFVNIEIKV